MGKSRVRIVASNNIGASVIVLFIKRENEVRLINILLK